ncbi:dynein regulatory complex protein 1 [Chamaea fasciata]|uniref:dynein regulatory complex protein 1 n=1 Tax=Chamaea fasciata TaxID=190680 RepID=UPI00336AAF02
MEREALGEKVEQEEEEKEEEEESKSQRLLEETGKALAKLRFHGTQLVTNVQVEADLWEWRRREKEGPERRRRLEKLEREAKQGTEKLAEINSKWALARDLKVPQELWDLLEQQRDQCEQLLEEKNQLIRELQQELKAKDEQYEQALKEQEGEIRLLLERMEEQTRNMLQTYRHHLWHIEKTFGEERREMVTNNRRRWDEAIQAHNEQELEFLRQQMDKALQFEKQLNELQDESLENYDAMKLQLEQDVEYLERKLRQLKGIYHLNQVKLEYDLDVLRQRDVENSATRSLQKRKISRFQTTLGLLKAKMSAQERKFQEEKQSLESELERVTGLFQETWKRTRDLVRRGSERFRQLWLANEEEAKALIRRVLDASRLIHVQQLGMPWEEPRLRVTENVGPLGGRRQKKDAVQAAARLMEGIGSGKGEQEGKRSKKKGVGKGEGGKENQERVEERATSRPNISRETLRKILELLSEESGFLLENKLLRPLRDVAGARDTVEQLRSIFRSLRIEDEDELRELLDFFLDHESREAMDSQDIPGGDDPTDPAQDGGDGGSHSQGDELPSPGSSVPALSIQADDVLRILKEFLRNFEKLRDEGPPKEIQDVRDNSKDREYWESMTCIIPEQTLKLWDALGAALLEYHKVLTRRSELFSEVTTLQRENSELGMLLEEYLGSPDGR